MFCKKEEEEKSCMNRKYHSTKQQTINNQI